VRIDHVLGLGRLFVVPAGATAADGAYLRYPITDLLGQLTLESTRAKCLVVGEDLGTVPEGMRDTLSFAAVLSYRVLWFERDGETFRRPSGWPRLAAACVSTHDLPTLEGWWEGVDITEEAGLGRIDSVQAAAQRAAREQAKVQLVDMLRAEKLLGEEVPGKAPVAAIHALIARTPAALALVQADDLAGELVGLNLPGTDMERPNWRRRIGCTADALKGSQILQVIRGERPSAPHNS
jgi:glycogen operon protein